MYTSPQAFPGKWICDQRRNYLFILYSPVLFEFLPSEHILCRYFIISKLLKNIKEQYKENIEIMNTVRVQGVYRKNKPRGKWRHCPEAGRRKKAKRGDGG